MDKRESLKAYQQAYYTQNKEKLNKNNVDKRRIVRNSEEYIDKNQQKIIDELNNKTRKFVHVKTLEKYNIKYDPIRLKYYSLNT